MATDNETVAEIVREMNFCHEGMIAFEFQNYASRFETAHKREVDDLNFKLLTAKSEQKAAANVIIEQTNKVEKLQREVEELQRRIEKMKKIDKELVDENDAIRAKLKVAEVALDSAWMYADKLPHQWPLPKMVIARMKNALAAIREEGGAK